MDPDTALGCSLDPNNILAPRESTGHSDHDGSGGGTLQTPKTLWVVAPTPGIYLSDLWWQHTMWTSTQTPTAVGPQTQTWFSAASRSSPAPGDNAGHSDLPYPCGSMVLKYTNIAPELRRPHGLQAPWASNRSFGP